MYISRYVLYIAAIALIIIGLSAAQKANTTESIGDLPTVCQSLDLTSYIPALGSAAACKSEAACRSSFFTPGYPNTYGNLALPTNPKFRFRQHLTQDPLYIILSDPTGKAARKMRFFLEVDRYSLLELEGSAGLPEVDIGLFEEDKPIDAASIAQMEAITFSAEFGGFATPPVNRTRVVTKDLDIGVQATNRLRQIAAFYTLIIELDRGEVKSLKWESGCFTCKKDACWSGPEWEWCTIPYNTCKTVSATAIDTCNIKIYVGWKGTDVDGNYLMSSQKSIKNFLQFDLNTPFEDATRTFTDLKPGGNDDGYY